MFYKEVVFGESEEPHIVGSLDNKEQVFKWQKFTADRFSINHGIHVLFMMGSSSRVTVEPKEF